MSSDTVGGIDFSGESFVVKSALIGTNYALKTAAGTELLRCKRLFFDEDVAYVYLDDSGTERLRYERADGAETTGGYVLVESETETTLATLDRADDDAPRWDVTPASSASAVASIEAEPSGLPVIGSTSGRKMKITDSTGEQIGTVRRRLLAVHFMFDVDISGIAAVPRAAVVLAVPMLYDVI